MNQKRFNLLLESRGLLNVLIEEWKHEEDRLRKLKLKRTIIGIVEQQERSTFLIRFLLRDFKSWNRVLTHQEDKSTLAKKPDFYESHLIAVLSEYEQGLEPLKAIKKVLERVKNELTLADFKLTRSNRFRYDTNIRFLANSLRKQEVLSNSKEHKNKLWVLN